MAVRFALSKPEVSTVLVGFSDILQLEQAVSWADAGPLDKTVFRHLAENGNLAYAYGDA